MGSIKRFSVSWADMMHSPHPRAQQKTAFGVPILGTPARLLLPLLKEERGATKTRNKGDETMPRGEKTKYTNKQKRQAEHIAEGYEGRGVSQKEAKRRAWATVNEMTGGGKKSGSGRGKKTNPAPAKKGGRLGGAASAARPAAERSASARKAARTRKRHQHA
jgi:hypothetical protein